MLRAVQRAVRARHHGFQALAPDVLRNAAGRRDAEVGHFVGDAERAELITDAIGDDLRAGRIGVHEHEHELLTAEARHIVDVAHRVRRDLRELAQNEIALAVTEDVVDAFEVVDVEVAERELVVRSSICERLLLRQRIHQEAPIVDPCQLVPDRHVAQAIEGEREFIVPLRELAPEAVQLEADGCHHAQRERERSIPDQRSREVHAPVPERLLEHESEAEADHERNVGEDVAHVRHAEGAEEADRKQAEMGELRQLGHERIEKDRSEGGPENLRHGHGGVAEAPIASRADERDEAERAEEPAAEDDPVTDGAEFDVPRRPADEADDQECRAARRRDDRPPQAQCLALCFRCGVVRHPAPG